MHDRTPISLNAYREPGNLFDDLLFYLKNNQQRVQIGKYKRVLGMVLANLSTTQWISYARRNTIPVSRYNKWQLKTPMICTVIDWLEDQGYIRHIIGRRTHHYSLIQAYPGFIKKLNGCKQYQEEYIILRDKAKEPTMYQDTTYTNLSRLAVAAYNELLDTFDFDLNGKKYSPQYYRIYNEDFESGGRYYRADVLTIPSMDRLDLKIDDKPVVEVDYVSFHIALLMGQNGLVLEQDPYNFYEDRQIAKKVLNILLNADNLVSAKRAILSEVGEELDISADEVIQAAIAHLPEVQGSFYSGEGLRMMHLESEIATSVMSVFTAKKKPILIIHDGFIVQDSDMFLLMECMLDAFLDAINEPGGNIPCYVKYAKKARHNDRVYQVPAALKRGEKPKEKIPSPYLLFTFELMYDDSGKRIYYQELKDDD